MFRWAVVTISAVTCLLRYCNTNGPATLVCTPHFRRCQHDAFKNSAYGFIAVQSISILQNAFRRISNKTPHGGCYGIFVEAVRRRMAGMLPASNRLEQHHIPYQKVKQFSLGRHYLRISKQLHQLHWVRLTYETPLYSAFFLLI